MYISKIEIKNFRNFKDVSFSTNPKIILIGENKSGKTNLLYALRLVLDDSLPDTQRYLDKNDFNYSIECPIENGKEISISIEFSDFSDDLNLLSILCDYLVDKDKAKITYRFMPKEDVIFDKSKSGEKLNINDYMYYFYGGNDPLNVIYKKDFLSVIRMRILEAIRDVENDLSLWSKSPLRKLVTNDDIVNQNELEQKLEEIQVGISDITNTFTESDIVKNLQHKIDLFMNDVAGRATIQTNIDLAGNKDINDILKIIRISSGDQNNFILGLDKESLGLNNLLYYSLFMLSESSLNSVIGIEEPESHLHPHLQRMIFKNSINKTPLILTTHSQNLVNTLPNIRDVVVLHNKGTHSEVSSLSKIDLNDREINNIQRYLDVNRSEMLFAKGVILVEGKAEEYLISEFAKLCLKEDLDKLGISICAINGKHFEDYIKLLKQINIPFVVITDGDKTQLIKEGISKGEYLDGIIRGLSIIQITKPMTIPRIITKYRADLPILELKKGKLSRDCERIKESLKLLLIKKPNIFDDLLLENNIFINSNTLEKELLNNNYQEIFIKIFRNYFSDSVIRKISQELDDDLCEYIMKKIIEIGKGRFAQELSIILNESCIVPNYISNAIIRIKELII